MKITTTPITAEDYKIYFNPSVILQQSYDEMEDYPEEQDRFMKIVGEINE